MVICPSMISGEMLLTMIIIRIQRKMTTRRGNPSQDQGRDLAARKSRVVVAAPVQVHPALEAVARKSPRNEDLGPPALPPPADPDPEARNALLAADLDHDPAVKSGHGHTTKRAKSGHGGHHRVRAPVAAAGLADQDLGIGQERSASKDVASPTDKNIDSVA